MMNKFGRRGFLGLLAGAVLGKSVKIPKRTVRVAPHVVEPMGMTIRMPRTYEDHEELWLFGQKTTEVWYNSGAANFPFQRITGAFIDEVA